MKSIDLFLSALFAGLGIGLLILVPQTGAESVYAGFVLVFIATFVWRASKYDRAPVRTAAPNKWAVR